MRLGRLLDQADQLVAEAKSDGAQLAERLARTLRAELLRTKHAVEDEIVTWVLDCDRCGLRVHWVVGDGVKLGHWAHAEPAPKAHGPVLWRAMQ